jgi:hypothetical protein
MAHSQQESHPYDRQEVHYATRLMLEFVIA